MSSKWIYIVEDDKNIREMEQYALGNSGFQVKGFDDGKSFFKECEETLPGLIILDIMLPGEDGMSILKLLRASPSTAGIPVMMVTAKDSELDKVKGLDLGADDYMAKPFHLGELGARVRSLTRRRFIQHDVSLTYGELSFDTRSRRAAAKGEIVILTRKENGILEYLLLNQGRPVSQEELIEHVWDGSVDVFSNSIRVHISSLRKKLRAVLGYDPIINRIGEGYHLGGCDEN